MKKINVNNLQIIKGGTKPPGCGTVGAMVVLTSIVPNYLISNYWQNLAGICWDN